MKKRCTESPGPIILAETIARGVYSPDMFDLDTGKLTAAAVKLDELISAGGLVDDCGDSSGVSVFRLDYLQGQQEASLELQNIVNRPRKDGRTRSAIGFAKLKAADIVGISGGPLLLLDDGKIDITCHAVIRAPSDRPKSSLRGVRDELVQMMDRSLVRF